MVKSDIVRNASGVRTILKTHNIAASMDGIVFPDLSLIGNSIYIIRDPRDIVVSWSKHSNKSLGEAEDDLLNESFAIDKKTASSRKEILSSWENRFLGWSNSKLPSFEVQGPSFKRRGYWSRFLLRFGCWSGGGADTRVRLLGLRPWFWDWRR